MFASNQTSTFTQLITMTKNQFYHFSWGLKCRTSINYIKARPSLPMSTLNQFYMLLANATCGNKGMRWAISFFWEIHLMLYSNAATQEGGLPIFLRHSMLLNLFSYILLVNNLFINTVDLFTTFSAILVVNFTSIRLI